MKKIIFDENAPKAIGPYSQAVQCSGEFLFISGQLPLNAQGEMAGDTIEAQTEQALTNIMHILKQAGMSADNVVKTTVLLSDIGNFAKMNEVYAKYFTKDFPARAAYQVAALPKNALVEIESIAVK